MRHRINELIPFTAHRTKISDDFWTMPEGGEDVQISDVRMMTLLDRANGDLSDKRMLDPQKGSREVAGVEARETNYRRCVLVKELLNLTNLTFYKCDVKDVEKGWLGELDLVHCAGIITILATDHAVSRNALDGSPIHLSVVSLTPYNPNR
jgi:hypothetical protein